METVRCVIIDFALRFRIQLISNSTLTSMLLFACKHDNAESNYSTMAFNHLAISYGDNGWMNDTNKEQNTTKPNQTKPHRCERNRTKVSFKTISITFDFISFTINVFHVCVAARSHTNHLASIWVRVIVFLFFSFTFLFIAFVCFAACAK